MNEENNTNYYAIIPATIRYNTKLKANEKLLYGELTALSNKYGYCYATNKYFSNLYNVNPHTVSQWISHLEKLGYVKIELIRNSNKEIKERRIYICDIPYVQKNTYPYMQKDTKGIDKKVKENNTRYNIDDLFYLIINNSLRIPNDFYVTLNNLELLYTEDILQMMKPNKIQMLKEITYILYEIFNSNLSYLLSNVNRETLLNLYISSQEHNPNDLLNYYKKTIINKYTNSKE